MPLFQVITCFESLYFLSFLGYVLNLIKIYNEGDAYFTLPYMNLTHFAQLRFYFYLTQSSISTKVKVKVIFSTKLFVFLVVEGQLIHFSLFGALMETYLSDGPAD